MRSIEPVTTTGGAPSAGSIASSNVSSSCERLAEAGDLALPEVVEQRVDAALVRLLGRPVAELAVGPLGVEQALEVLRRRRRLAAGQALAALLRERLERGVGGRARTTNAADGPGRLGMR